MSRLTQHLVVFAKVPRLGTVKSRLAADLGMVEALRIYRGLAEGTLRPLSRDPRWQTYLALTPDRLALTGFNWSQYGAVRLAQGPGDLGDRLGRLNQDLAPGPVVFIGTDLPNISQDRIARAFKALGDHDAVIGPAGDGGYWLIGFKRRPKIPHVLDNIRWSNPDTLNDTLRNIEKEIPTARVKMLEQLDDIDDIQSYQKWQKKQHD
jgi:uncharacterized protein